MFKIISGGQTGVDRAALDVALELGLTCGGFCPSGRISEDGRISEKYPLTETPTSDYTERTIWNVRDSNATLILVWGPPTGGTLLALETAKECHKPYLLIDFQSNQNASAVISWLLDHCVRVLNIAGPRASTQVNCYEQSFAFLYQVLSRFQVVKISDLNSLNRFAHDFLRKWPKGARVGLCADLGLGKTTFVRRCAQILAKKNVVSIPRILSPSFVIHQYYPNLKPSLDHVDLYRLDSITDQGLLDIGYWDAHARGGYLFVEWPERSQVALGLECLIYFEFKAQHRRILSVSKRASIA